MINASSFRRMRPRRHSVACTPTVIPAHAGIQCNNESPPAYDMPGQAPAVPYEQECTFRVNWKS